MPEIEPHPELCMPDYAFQRKSRDLFLVWLGNSSHSIQLMMVPNASHGLQRPTNVYNHDKLLTPHSFERVLTWGNDDFNPIFLLHDDEDTKNLELLLGSTWEEHQKRTYE